MTDELERYQPPQPYQPYPPYAPQPPSHPYGTGAPHHGAPGHGVVPQQAPHGAHAYYPYLPGRPLPTAPPKSPGVAVILSLLITGLGHLYTGNPVAAVLWFLGAFVAAMLITVGIGLLLLPCVWVGAAVHAHVSASAYNHRHHAVL